MRVDQTFHVDLSELGNVHNGDGEGIAVELDGRRVPVRAHEGRAVGEKDRVIEHCVQLFHQRVIGLRSHALSRAVDVWDDAGVHAVLHAQRAGFVHDLAAAEDLAEEFRRFGGVLVVLEHLRCGTGLAVHDEAALADVGHSDVGLVGKAADRALAGSARASSSVRMRPTEQPWLRRMFS